MSLNHCPSARPAGKRAPQGADFVLSPHPASRASPASRAAAAGLTRQLVRLQPTVRVDPAQHEVVREAAGGRGGARARAGRRAAPAHPGRTAPAAAAAARES